jgi:hypothetical protein
VLSLNSANVALEAQVRLPTVRRNHAASPCVINAAIREVDSHFPSTRLTRFWLSPVQGLTHCAEDMEGVLSAAIAGPKRYSSIVPEA